LLLNVVDTNTSYLSVTFFFRELIMNIPSPMTAGQFDNALCNPAILKAYVSHVLTETRTSKYPPQVALDMMDRAWEAQVLLWQLRDNQVDTI
jgi:hypothetical protein